MLETQNKLAQLLETGFNNISQYTELELSKKSTCKKWSKKEILGHLIDSGVNNLQRFTEIQFEEKPYKIRNYKQQDLVIANNYQDAASKELLDFWMAINNRILHVISKQTEESLSYKIEFENHKTADLRFLIADYVAHLEHHLNQIIL